MVKSIKYPGPTNMFFYIGKECELLQQADGCLFVDAGWINCDNCWLKGYSTECDISKNIQAIIDGYQPRGIWALIHKSEGQYVVKHSELRGFPLFRNKDNDTTNIPNLNGFELVYCNVGWSIDHSELSLEEVVNRVTEILVENVEGVMKYNSVDTMTVLATGGLDSTVAWATIESVASYELVRCSPSDSTREYSSPLIQYMNTNHWSYGIINLYDKINWNLTGFAAEAMTIRRPDMFNTICRFNGTTVDSSVTSNDYMYYFMQRPSWKKIFEEQTQVYTNLREKLLSQIDVDYYMWHIDYNFHVSPFYDKRIAETCVRLRMEDLIENCKNGIVEKLVLQKIRPDFLSLISRYKNYGRVMKNFDENFATLQLKGFDNKS
jgi:hypothetical protein